MVLRQHTILRQIVHTSQSHRTRLPCCPNFHLSPYSSFMTGLTLLNVAPFFPPSSHSSWLPSLVHSVLSVFNLHPISLPLSLCPSILPRSFRLTLCPCSPVFRRSFFSRRQQRQRLGAGYRQAPTRGPGAAAGSDQVHPQGAAVALQGLQERKQPPEHRLDQTC